MCLWNIYFQNLSLSGLSKLGALYVDERILFNSSRLENMHSNSWLQQQLSFDSLIGFVKTGNLSNQNTFAKSQGG